jgi:hypothetical protein
MVHSSIGVSVVKKRKCNSEALTEADCDIAHMGYVPKIVRNLLNASQDNYKKKCIVESSNTN